MESTEENMDDAPFHVLMSPPLQGSTNKKRLIDPRLERDYLAKRYRALASDDDSREEDDDEEGNIWQGASLIERRLVACCEKAEEDEDPIDGGALDKDKEVLFVGLLARDCHTIATRSLALAILERTLETYLSEVEEAEKNDEEQSADDDDIDSLGSDDDTDWRPGVSGTRRSPRTRNNNRRSKPNKTSSTKMQDRRDNDDDSDDEPDRLDSFLAAGGLRVLNRWLVDGSTLSSSNSKQSTTVTEPSPMRPLVLPILSILEHIPFDKKLVMESKINKQIKRLGKQVDGILEAVDKGKHREVDIENWTFEPSGNGKDALIEVRDTINTIKESWEEMVKRPTEKISDPFQSLKVKMRERLDLINQFIAGDIEKPDWFEEPENGQKVVRPQKKSSVELLALKERQSEREELRKQLKAVENEHRQRVARLREQLQKRREENAAPPARIKKSTAKQVSWKDGIRAHGLRNRKLLEEVFHYSTQKNEESRLLENSSKDSIPSLVGSGSDNFESTSDFMEDRTLI